MPPSPNRSLAASIGAHSKWMACPDRKAAMAPAHAGFEAKFEAMVPPEVTGDDRVKAVANARALYFRRLALASAKARAARKG